MIVTAPPAPRRRSDTVQGDSPAARASAVRHTSPPTMQIPVRTACATSAPTAGSPAAGPAAARTAPTRVSSPTYSSVPWPAAERSGGMSRTRPAAKKLAPQERAAGRPMGAGR